MPTTMFKLSPGFKKLEMLLKPSRFQADLNRNIGKALQLNGQVAVRAMRKTIKAGVPPSNAGLTRFIKGSSKPLVDSGQLFGAITAKRVGPLAVFVGVLRSDKAFNVAVTVHNGAHIRVTDRMRGMFFALWLASTGKMDPAKLKGAAAELWARRKGNWKPLGEGKAMITIPRRPFVEITFADGSMKKRMTRNFKRASELALAGKKS